MLSRKTLRLQGAVFASTTVLIFTLFTVASYAFSFDALDFQRRYQLLEAERQFDSEEFAEARKTFQQLAESAGSKAEGAALLARAAVALGHQEGQFEAAMREAAALDHEPSKIYAIISLKASQSDWSGIVEQFGDIPVDDWEAVRLPARPRGSEEELRTFVFLKRGRAFEQTGAYERAEQDLTKAAELVVSRHWRARPSLLSVLTSLAELRERRLDDAEGAFEANKRIAEIGHGGARYYRGILRAGAYLREQERYDEAIEMIKLMKPHSRPPHGSWFGNGMLALGNTYRAAGKLEEAEKIYTEILESPNVNPQFEQRAARLKAEVQVEAAGWQLAFDDHFNRQSLGEMWEALEGTWTIDDEMLQGSGILISSRSFPERDETGRVYTGGFALGYIRMDFDLQSADEQASDPSFFMNAYWETDEEEAQMQRGYTFKIGGRDDSHHEISKRDGDPVAVAEDSDVVFKPGESHRIVAENDEGHLRLYIDGKLVLEHEEQFSIMGSGFDRVGFHFVRPFRVDNLKVYIKRLPGGLDRDEELQRSY